MPANVYVVNGSSQSRRSLREIGTGTAMLNSYAEMYKSDFFVDQNNGGELIALTETKADVINDIGYAFNKDTGDQIIIQRNGAYDINLGIGAHVMFPPMVTESIKNPDPGQLISAVDPVQIGLQLYINGVLKTTAVCNILRMEGPEHGDPIYGSGALHKLLHLNAFDVITAKYFTYTSVIPFAIDELTVSVETRNVTEQTDGN